MPQDFEPVCSATTIEQADIIVAWLADNGVEAHVKDRYTIGTLTWGTPAVAPHGVEVVVAPQRAQEARRLLAARDANPAPAPHPDDTNPISATCEDCAGTSTFPHTQQGQVQNCPHCGAYIDIPETPQ